MENLTGADVKKILAPVLDFDKRSATALYSETLPPEVQKAIKEKRALVGMDRDQVLLAMGHPDHKYRESKDGVETEDWIFGTPPGKIVFVTFTGNKVVKVKEQYAGLGSQTVSHSKSTDGLSFSAALPKPRCKQSDPTVAAAEAARPRSPAST